MSKTYRPYPGTAVAVACGAPGVAARPHAYFISDVVEELTCRSSWPAMKGKASVLPTNMSMLVRLLHRGGLLTEDCQPPRGHAPSGAGGEQQSGLPISDFRVSLGDLFLQVLELCQKAGREAGAPWMGPR